MKANPDPNYPIEVVLGQVFTISLESIPSTGYRWNPEYDSNMIELVKSKYEPYSSAAGIVGGGGREIFKFQAKQPDETSITAKYQQGKQMPSKMKLFKILIQQ